MPTTIATGQKAPDVTLARDGGGMMILDDLAGRNVVLFFYPKDDTSGCTKEAVGFSQRQDEFAAIDAVVVGVSRDSVASHDKFRDKHDLNIPLLSDADGEVTERFGVWVEKSMYGRKFMGIERSTFLIDRTGTIRQIWRNVKVPGHVDAVLEAARKL